MSVEVVRLRLTRTWQPVTPVAFAASVPERPRRLTECYVPVGAEC